MNKQANTEGAQMHYLNSKHRKRNRQIPTIAMQMIHRDFFGQEKLGFYAVIAGRSALTSCPKDNRSFIPQAARSACACACTSIDAADLMDDDENEGVRGPLFRLVFNTTPEQMEALHEQYQHLVFTTWQKARRGLLFKAAHPDLCAAADGTKDLELKEAVGSSLLLIGIYSIGREENAISASKESKKR